MLQKFSDSVACLGKGSLQFSLQHRIRRVALLPHWGIGGHIGDL
jgi:hypothetical protein